MLINYKIISHGLTDHVPTQWSFLAFMNIHYNSKSTIMIEKASLFSFWRYENEQVLDVIKTSSCFQMCIYALMQLIRFPSQKFKEANQNRAWIIHKNKKISANFAHDHHIQYLFERRTDTCTNCSEIFIKGYCTRTVHSAYMLSHEIKGAECFNMKFILLTIS